MCRTFAVLVPKEYENNVTIEKFHLNIWYLDSTEVYVDIGCLFELKEDHDIPLENTDNCINMYLLMPFRREESNDLKDTLMHPKTLKLIFNTDNVEVISNEDDVIKVDNDKYYLISPRIDNDNEMFRVSLSVPIKNPDDKHYFRIRFKVNSKKILCIKRAIDKYNKLFMKRRDFNLLNEYLYFDIRINEPRLISDDELKYNTKKLKLCHADKTYIFLVVPDYYKPDIDINKNLKNSRFLESEKGLWNRYLNELEKCKKGYIVYFWKVSGGESANITVLFERLVSSWSVVVVILLITLHQDIINLLTNYLIRNEAKSTLILIAVIVLILCGPMGYAKLMRYMAQYSK
jgi:hypothetical protein